MNKGIWEVLTGTPFLFNNPIELNAFQTGFYIFCALVGLLFLAFAYWRAVSVHWDAGSPPKCHITRRIWFWATLGGLLAVLWAYTEFYVQNGYVPRTPPILLSQWENIQMIGLVVAFVVYLLFGLGSSVASKGKWKTILQKTVK